MRSASQMDRLGCRSLWVNCRLRPLQLYLSVNKIIYDCVYSFYEIINKKFNHRHISSLQWFLPNQASYSPVSNTDHSPVLKRPVSAAEGDFLCDQPLFFSLCSLSFSPLTLSFNRCIIQWLNNARGAMSSDVFL